MTKIPFENIYKLYYLNKFNLKGLPSFEQYLDGIEQHYFGGTCYTNNNFFFTLLEHLGFNAKRCGADMTDADVHMVIIVEVENNEYLIDTGYAAPFIEPLPLDLDVERTVQMGRDRYVLNPKDEKGNSRMDLYRDGELVHGYTAKPIHRELSHFDDTIKDSFTEESVFMKSLLMVKLFGESSTIIRNLDIIHSTRDNFRVNKLDSIEELPKAITEHFGISEDISNVALSSLKGLGDPYD